MDTNTDTNSYEQLNPMDENFDNNLEILYEPNQVDVPKTTNELKSDQENSNTIEDNALTTHQEDMETETQQQLYEDMNEFSTLFNIENNEHNNLEENKEFGSYLAENNDNTNLTNKLPKEKNESEIKITNNKTHEDSNNVSEELKEIRSR